MPIGWVVKIGGSLAYAEELPFWLQRLVSAKVVLVPGGGPFADQVRRAQRHWAFGDDVAHAMAILAMAQYGLMLSGLCPAFATGNSLHQLVEAVNGGHSAIWLPQPAHLDCNQIPPSWDVTSDSLAAWLARRVGAQKLLLVKSAVLPNTEFKSRDLVQQGIVDTAFPAFAASGGFETLLASREDFHHFREDPVQTSGRFSKLLYDN